MIIHRYIQLTFTGPHPVPVPRIRDPKMSRPWILTSRTLHWSTGVQGLKRQSPYRGMLSLGGLWQVIHSFWWPAYGCPSSHKEFQPWGTCHSWKCCLKSKDWQDLEAKYGPRQWVVGKPTFPTVSPHSSGLSLKEGAASPNDIWRTSSLSGSWWVGKLGG